MSLRALLGLENTAISDVEIVKRIKESMDKGSDTVTFTAKDGSKIVVKLPNREFGNHLDPWDGKQGKANYPKI